MQADAPDDLPGDVDMTRLLEALRDTESPQLRERLARRISDSAARHAALVTSRGGRRAVWAMPAPGVRVRTLYGAASPMRPGQPQGVYVVEMAAGSRWTPPEVDSLNQVEWLVLRGEVRLEANAPVELHALDFHVQAALSALPTVRALSPARLYMRHAPRLAALTSTSRETADGWVDMAPGILRRRLWTRGDEAAYLVRAERGAQVPEHDHGHDEECLMIEGDLFLGDVLLRADDWQLAPRGSRHGHHRTDTGLLLLVRGDAEMRFDVAAG